jgi:hypothetical protein
VVGALSAGVKQLDREADYSPTSAEVKKALNYTSTSSHAFMIMDPLPGNDRQMNSFKIAVTK